MFLIKFFNNRAIKSKDQDSFSAAIATSMPRLLS
jgi:hypothetical protein